MRFLSGAATFAAALVIAASAANAQAAAGPKYGYINLPQVMQSAPGRAEAEAQFQKEMQGYQAQIQRMGDSLNVLIADYNKQEASLSPVAKDTKQKSIRAKEEEYQGRQQKLQQQVQAREAELVQPVINQVKKILDGIRAEGNYAMIFDTAAGAQQGIAFVVAADPSLDLTQQVITRLQASPKPTASGATAPSGARTAAPAGLSARPKTP